MRRLTQQRNTAPTILKRLHTVLIVLCTLALLSAALGVALKASSTGQRARYEPPDGSIYHGTAPNPTVVESYINVLGDEDIAPLIEGIHLGAAGTSGRQYVVDTICDWLHYVREAGRIPHLSLSMTTGTGEPSDVEIATSTNHDAVLSEIGAVIAAFGDPLFIRIGFEFNGAWNGYTAGVYPLAYRKMVDLFRAAGVEQAAYI